MPEKESRWRRFQAIKRKPKDFSRRAKRVEGATLRHAHKFLVGRWDNIRNVRQHIVVWMSSVAALIVVVGAQMFWSQQGYMTTAPVSGGVYAEAAIGPVQTLDPLYATSSAEQSASQLLFSSLYTYDTTGHLRGDVATGMTIDPTNKIYTVKLRHDVRWSDGQRLTAADVAFTVGLMKDPSARSVMNASWKDVGATALDDSTVQFTLPAAYAAFPQALTFSILPQHTLKNVDPHTLRENNFSNSPVGSGPFALRLLQTVNSSSGRKIVHMAANEQYYGGKPRLDRFQLHVYGSMDDIARALRTGEVSAAADVSGDVANTATATGQYIVQAKPINSGVYAILNTTQVQLKDAKVRRALQLATDTSAVRSSLYGHPQALDLPFVKGQLTGSDIPARPAPNLAQAAALLDTAGWKVGADGVRTKDGQPLELRVVTRKNSDYEHTLEILAGQWRKIGVTIDKTVIDPADTSQSYQLILQKRDYDVLVDELVIGGDPDVFAYWHSRGLLNFSNYSDPTSDDALVSARSRVEPEVRNARYVVFAKQWLHDVPAIGLYQSNMLYVQSKNVNSITGDETIVSPADRYEDVQYWTAETGNVFTTP